MEFHPNELSDLDDLTEEHLGFSALSEGLGFSRGREKLPAKAMERPLAPKNNQELRSIDIDFEEDPTEVRPEVRPTHSAPPANFAKKPAPYYGSGATLAGPVRVSPSITATPKTSTILGPTPVGAAQVLAEPAAPRLLRFAAFALDATIIFVPLSLAWLLSFGSASKEIFTQDIVSPLSLFAVIFGAYFLLSESFGGQSPGKMLLNLRVVEDDKYQKPTGFKHATARLGLFVIGALCFGFGFFASFLDSKRRPWHDRYSGSIVRRSA